MKCKVCGSKYFTPVFDVVYCDRCGVAYSIECPDEIIEVDKVKLKQYFDEVVKKVKDDVKREYIKGLFEGYYSGLFDNRKKVREWSLSKIIDLLTQLSGKRG